MAASASSVASLTPLPDSTHDLVLNHDVLFYLINHLDLETLKSFAFLSRAIHNTATVRLWQSISVRPDPSCPSDPHYFVSAASFIKRPEVRRRIQRVTIIPPEGDERDQIAEFMAALRNCPKLDSLRIWAGDNWGYRFFNFDTAFLPPTLRSLETDMTRIIKSPVFGPSLEHLALNEVIPIIAAPLPHLASLCVQGIGQCIHVANRPVSEVVIGDYTNWSTIDIPEENLYTLLSQSTAPIKRLTIRPTRERIPERPTILRSLYSDIGRFAELRFLSLHHTSLILDQDHVLRNVIFETIASLRYLEELEWSEEISPETRGALLDFTAAKCLSIRWVRMLTGEKLNEDDVLLRSYEAVIDPNDDGRFLVERTSLKDLSKGSPRRLDTIVDESG